MKLVEFEMLKRKFSQSDTKEKIEMYINADDLTQEQYMELLKMFPLSEINQLEDAMV